MKSKNVLCGISIAVALHFGVLAGSAQTNLYLFNGFQNIGWKTNITLNPGTYIITAYGAPGGYGTGGAEMSAEFNFSTSTTLTLLVGGGGTYGSDRGGSTYGGGGGGGSFVVQGSTPLVIAGGSGGGGFLASGSGGTGSGYNDVGGEGGSSFEAGGFGGINNNNNDGGWGGYGGGGSSTINYYNSLGGELSYYGGGGGGGYSGGGGGYYSSGVGSPSSGDGGGGGGSIIDSSAIAILAEVTPAGSPDDPGNGEIIITALPPPLSIIADGANVVLTWPAADTGFTTTGYRVESATSLVPPVAWQTNSTAPIVIGGQDIIISPISGAQKFYRLIQ